MAQVVLATPSRLNRPPPSQYHHVHRKHVSVATTNAMKQRAKYLTAIAKVQKHKAQIAARLAARKAAPFDRGTLAKIGGEPLIAWRLGAKADFK